MTSEQILEKLYSIIEENFSPEIEVKPTTTFDEFAIDSLDTVEFIMAAEEEFDIEISDEEVENEIKGDSTVQQAADFIFARIP